MLIKLFLAAALVASGSPGIALTVPSPYSASFSMVPQLMCVGDKGGLHSGSGVRIGDDLIITAAHVNSHSTCNALSVRLDNTRFEPTADIGFVQGKFGDGFRAIVSCEGIKEGQRYLALGYADGGAPNVEPLVGSSLIRNGQVMMHGHVYHGMSGGAVLNDQGALVAIINAMNSEGRPIAWVTPLTQTYLCKGSADA